MVVIVLVMMMVVLVVWWWCGSGDDDDDDSGGLPVIPSMSSFFLFSGTNFSSRFGLCVPTPFANQGSTGQAL